ncbi:RNA-directed DNA polymerase, eukaryota, reverse transcriptase zinc-binding domain protein [Tanacetum coccineum]|uniref:RNA-directed DNA polymerase, eukaryota, reverse transcriptase zinc-binding domain protein n=1 Tax=Tanacetum coccineum TaxID=301880 RepID=A0ABQ5HNF1_9ASTR
MLKDGLAANLFWGIKIGSPSLHLSHLFYADDVIIFAEWHQSDMDNIIRILDVFSLILGLKSISTSPIFMVWGSLRRKLSIWLKVRVVPLAPFFSYLGLPIGSNMGRISNWTILIDHFKARLSSWKTNLLSLGGRLTLIKAVLGSLGGLGVASLKAFNASLLLKWRWRLLKNPNALWVNVVKSIHGDEAGIDRKGCQTNGLWARIVVTWLGDVPLCSRFNRLFRLERDCTLRDHFANGDWSWDWYRPINGGRTLADLNSLLMDLSSVILSNDVDVVSSSLSSDGIYSVSDVRIHIDDCMLLNSLPCTRWFKAIPRKVNIFMWRLFLDRLPHRLNLSSRGLDIDSIMCPLCNKHVESNSHGFFTCDTACGVWSLVRG